MAHKYTPEDLLFLRDSPLCKKPDNLPSQEEWMGPPAEQQPQQTRTQPQQTRNGHNTTAFGAFEKPRHGGDALLDQTNRRTDGRHASRNSASNPDDMIFGPPRTSFSSSGRKGFENDKGGREGDAQGRFSGLRNRSGDLDGDRLRDGRGNPLRRRGDNGDNDGEGWSTVKPRKSFGADGAERFHGRMGGDFRDDKRAPRERDDRSRRPLDAIRDDDEEGRPRSNGLGRTKPEWHKTEGSESQSQSRVPEKRERIDRARNWRERDPQADAHDDHGAGRSQDNRRWGREQRDQRDHRDPRGEREPEWLDEPAEPKIEARTQQDFQKWMEEMKKSKGSQSTGPGAEAAAAKPSVRSPAIETGPDKFFMNFGAKEGSSTPGEQAEPRAKPAGKSSRFTSFFASQDSGKPESPALAPPQTAPPAQPPMANGLTALLGAAPAAGSAAPDEEKQAFKSLLAKLQKQSMSATPPGASPFQAPPPPNDGGDNGQRSSQSPFQFPQGEGRHDGPLGRPPSQQPPQEILAPRPQPQSARPEQLLQDLVGHHNRISSQSSARDESHSNPNLNQPPQPSRNNSNTEFLMNLMRAGPDSQRSDSAMMRAAQQGQKHGPMPQPHEREGEYSQESRNSQRNMRPPPPPGFPVDDGFRGGEGDFGPNRPTQILQRPPPPPGLDQMPPGWMGGQMPPPQQHAQQPQQQQQQQRGPMLPPPPGLAGGHGRNGPGPNGPLPHMFPPNMPPMPPPDVMGNMPPPRGPPPPGFFNGPPPPHGFMPPGMGGFNGAPGPEPPFGGSPFEARGMPPPPSGGRGPQYGQR